MTARFYLGTHEPCSVACQHSTYRGAGNPKWRGGQTIDKDGYVLEYAPAHPNANRHGYVRQHRLVVERRLGRYLDADEVVHHDNGAKDDNHDENLVLLPSGGAHRTEHGDWQDGPCAHCGAPVRRSAGMRRRGVRACCSKRCAMLRRNAIARRAAS